MEMALSGSLPSDKKENSPLLETLLDNSDKEPQPKNVLSPECTLKKGNGKHWSSVPSLPITSSEKVSTAKTFPVENKWSFHRGTELVTSLSDHFFKPISGQSSKKKEDESKSEFMNKSDGTLPDVTEIESPVRVSGRLYSFSSEKPCDLLAQLEQQSNSSGSVPVFSATDTPAAIQVDKETESQDCYLSSLSPTNREGGRGAGEFLIISFDDNGNPCPSPSHQFNVFTVPDGEDQPGKETFHYPDTCEETDIAVTATEDTDSKSRPTAYSNVKANNFSKLDTKSENKNGQVEEPKYFINAAALSEENFPLSPSLNFPSLDYQYMVENALYKTSSANISETPDRQSQKTPSDTVRDVEESVFARPRVPISKSFPDIVQTTLNNDLDLDGESKESPALIMNTLTKNNSEPESLVADSLEELASLDSQPNIQERSTTFLNKDSPKDRGVPASLQLSEDSQKGGILAEKPPEAWVIDFNSISLDSEIESSETCLTQARRSNSGSNPNSLAFFVNIDDDEEDETLSLDSKSKGSESCDKGTATESVDKKIFSMFVDFRSKTESSCNQEARCQDNMISVHQHSTMIFPKKPIINKTVLNVMEDCGRSGLSISGAARNKFPSPIFQHKAAAEAARKAARLEMEVKAKSGKMDSFSQIVPPSTSSGDTTVTKPMDGSEISNRSSLHVANDIENSFSSSLLSSMENSQPTEMEMCQGGPCFKLGKDLLRMFQEGINTDVNITVNGRYVKAHKCILASRSQYFAAILSGHWVEKAGNTINLDGFSYNVVQFTMYHIYSGTNEIPDSIDLLELATLTDLLGLEGLRENISQTIRAKFCHNFHRPCTGCISGVIECFPIAIAYGMDELNRKMTKWICKHFVRIWPTKAFANLGDELIEKCLRYSVNHLSGDNILDHTLGCDQLLTTMPTVRWTEGIFSIVSQLSEACVQFIGENFCQVLQSQRFLLFGKGQTWNISRIEGTFTEAMLLLKPDEACLSHTGLCRLIELGTETIDEMFVDFLKLLRAEVERYLMANASKAVLSKCWEQLGQDIRKKICTSSFMGFDKYGNKITKKVPASSGASTMASTGHSKALIQNSREKSSSTLSVARGPSKTKGKASPYSSLPTCHPKDRYSESTTQDTTAANSVATTRASSNIAPKNKTKVASVRPMPNVNSTATLSKNAQEATQAPSTGTIGRVSIGKTAASTLNARRSYASASPRSSLQKQTSSGAVSQLRTAAVPDRERSFSNSARNSNIPSVNRTPLKPLTPMTPSKHSVITGTFPSKNTRGSSQRHSTNPSVTETTQKSFMNNSARAAAVSKPNLKSVSSRTSSSSSSVQHTPRTPNLTQPSRYGSSLGSNSNRSGISGSGGYSARNSFSNSERPERIVAIVKAKSTDTKPNQNTNVTSTGKNMYKKSLGYSQGHTTIPSTVRNNYGGLIAKGTTAPKEPLNPPSTQPSSNPSTAFLAVGDILSKENIMSRSTIETDSGETKIRTLAEIGRSSTFSKDEPTILGKMDGMNYDVEMRPL